MRRRLVVHVGTSKTGSTSIQHTLHSFAASLEQCGVHVPVTGRMHGKDCSILPVRDPPPLGGWKELEAELARCPARRFVLSSEDLTGPRLENREAAAKRVAGLAEALDLDVDVVGYVRPQYQRLEALYVQFVKMGTLVAPFDTVLRHVADVPRLGLDYAAAFRPWRETFADRLAVYPLEASRMPDGLLAHFLTVIGAGKLARAAAALPQMNQRLGAKHLEVLRLIGWTWNGRLIDSNAKNRRLDAASRRLPALLDGDVPFAGLSRSQVQAVTERFAETNARFAREYGIDPDGVLFREKAEDHYARPALAGWDDFSEAERTRVRRLVLDEVGVGLAVGRNGPATVVLNLWQGRSQPHRAVDTRGTWVRGNDWRSVRPPVGAAFTPVLPISVVVVVGRAGAVGLSRTLAALEGQTYPRDLIEVVVVNPDSVLLPSTALRVRHPQPASDAATLRNAGARAAAHGILLFLDAGLLPEAGCLAAHARWHHVLTDVVTLSGRTVASVDGVAPGNIRDRQGTLAELLSDRKEAQACLGAWSRHVPDDLTSRVGAWGGAIAGAPFGIGRGFFDLVGGFDDRLAGRMEQDVEFGARASTCGGLLAPVAGAGCFGPALDVALPEAAAAVDRPDTCVPPRCPRLVVTVATPVGRGRAAVETASRVLSDQGQDVVLVLDVRDEREVGYLRRQVADDPRLRVGSGDDYCREFPWSPLHARLSAGVNVSRHQLQALEDMLGDAVSVRATLSDGSLVSMTRAWALHRSRRTGRDVADFGRVVRVGARRMQPGALPVLVDFCRALVLPVAAVCSIVPAGLGPVRYVCRQAGELLAQARKVRDVRDVPAFLRWLRWEIEIRCRRTCRSMTGHALAFFERTLDRVQRS